MSGAGLAKADNATQPPVALQQFASEVETAGLTDYPGSFTGAVLTPTGVVDVYANTETDADLVSAVTALDQAGYPVTYIESTKSYSELSALTTELTNDQAQIAQDGVHLAEWGVDPTTDSVSVTLLAPTQSDLTAMSGQASTVDLSSAVTTATYPANAATVISSIVGAGYTVEPQVQAVLATGASGSAVASPDVGRGAGVAPFSGGDLIQSATDSCTGGFGVINASGATFMQTAGHCGQGPWSTPAQLMGDTAATFWQNTTDDDFQLINASSVSGYVNGSPTKYAVTGQLIPAVGTSITFDGDVTGEVNNNKVTANDIAVNVTDKTTGVMWTAAHQVLAGTGNSNIACTGGDSGGPAFQRTPNGTNINAVGTIVSYLGTPSGSQCTAEQIGVELSRSGTSLYLAPVGE